MENNRRPLRSAATYARRPVQSARATATTVAPPLVYPAPIVEPAATAPPTVSRELSINLHLGLPAGLKRLHRSNRWRRYLAPLRSLRVRTALVVIVLVVLASVIFPILEPHLIAHTYAMGQTESMLSTKDSFLASKLQLNNQTHSYDYNAGFQIANQLSDTETGGPQIKAVAYQDPSKGLQITDPLSNTEFDITPQFQLLPGKQDGNRIVYPLLDGTGWVVYTMQSTSVKEDVVLRGANGDSMKLKYDLGLDSQGLAAHLESDGSVGIYGSSLPIGSNVTTGNDTDAALLQKGPPARQKRQISLRASSANCVPKRSCAIKDCPQSLRARWRHANHRNYWSQSQRYQLSARH